MQTRHYSKKREAILHALRSTDTHPTAEWVYRTLKDEYPDLSLATVYRNLKLFKESGDAVSVCTVNGQERFDGNVDEHSHFVCAICHAVIDLDAVAPVDVLSKPGFLIDRVDLLAHGTCHNCLQGNALKQ